MAETEELQIKVTLVEGNTVEKLREMRKEIEALGGGGTAAQIERFSRQTREAREKGLKPFSEDLAEASKRMVPFIGGIGGIATGFLAVGYAADKALEGLNEFAKVQEKIGVLSKQTGFDPAFVKMFQEKFKLEGVDDATRDLQGLAHVMADITRANSDFRRKMMAGAGLEGAGAMQEFLAQLTEIKDPARFANKLREGLDNIRKNAIAKWGEVGGTERFRQFEMGIGMPDLDRLKKDLPAVSAEEKKLQADRQKAADDYLKTSREIDEHWEHIKDAWWDQTLGGSPLMDAMKYIEGVLGRWEKSSAKATEVSKAFPAPEGFWNKLNPFDPKNVERSRAMQGATSDTGPAAGQSAFNRGGFADWLHEQQTGEKSIIPRGGRRAPASPARPGAAGKPMHLGLFGGGGDIPWLDPDRSPMSSNIEDRRGLQGDDALKTQRELMEQTKRLADDFEQLTGTGTHAGGGGGLGLFSGGTGGGGLGGGGGGLAAAAGINDIGGGGGGGGGAPNGSDVGPGTGPGAGATPAGGGAAGVNAPGGGGGGAGVNASEMLAEKVKGFEGFEPKAKWDYKQYSSGYGTKAGGAGEPITKEEASKRLQTELAQAGQSVDAINPKLDPGTRAALTDLVFNAGPGALKGIKSAIASGDTDAIKKWLPEHITKAGGKDSPGLLKRRAEEATWVNNPAWKKAADGGAPGAGAAAPGTGVPSRFAADVTAMTLAGAQPHNIRAYMQSHGIDLSEATCGQFMASVVKEHGGHPPSGSALASNWNTFGGKEGAGFSADPNAINIAVRQGTSIGSSGSHVTSAIPIYDKDGQITGFRGVGANQFNPSGPEHGVGPYGRDVISSQRLSIGTGRGQYQIRHEIPRVETDNQMAQKVEGTGKLSVNVNAPKGTSVNAEGGGLFKKTEVTRQTQMEPAASSMASQYQE
jgi:lysozyme